MSSLSLKFQASLAISRVKVPSKLSWARSIVLSTVGVTVYMKVLVRLVMIRKSNYTPQIPMFDLSFHRPDWITSGFTTFALTIESTRPKVGDVFFDMVD